MNVERRERCRTDFRAFVETYFGTHVSEPFTGYQLSQIESIQKAVLSDRSHIDLTTVEGGMLRGTGQTTYMQLGALWVIAYGVDQFVEIRCQDDWHADMLKESLLLELYSYNAHARTELALDCTATRYGLVYPDRDAALLIRGQHAPLKGLVHKLKDGRRIRPSLLFYDVKEDE